MISIGYTKKLIFEIAETMYITDISPTKYADVMGLGWALKGNSHLYGTSWDFCGVLSIQNGKVNQQKWDIIVYPLWYNAGDVLGKPTAFYGYRVWQRRNPRFRQARVVIRKSSTVWSLGMIWNDNCLVFELIIWYSTLGTWNNICLMISVSFLLNNSCKLLDNCIYIFFLSFWGYYGGIVSWFQNCFFLYLLGVTMAL